MARFNFQMQQAISTITFVLIAIRLYVRCYLRRRFPNLSDYFVILAWVMYFIPVIIDEIVVPAYGEDRLDDAVWYNKWIYYWFIQYFSIYYAIKASLLLFYNEWIPRSLEKLWISNRVLMVITGICFAYTAGIQIFRCQPMSLNWYHPEICFAAYSYYVFVSISVLHLFTDVLIYILPVFVLYYMSNVTFSKKAGAAFMFLLGIISIFFSALRFGLSLWGIHHPGTVTGDTIFISQNLDESAGVFVVCCPALKIFLLRCWRFWKEKYAKYFGKGGRTSSSSSDLNEEGMMTEKDSKGDTSLSITVNSTVAVVSQNARDMEEGVVNSPSSSKSNDSRRQTVYPYPSTRNTMDTTYEERGGPSNSSRW